MAVFLPITKVDLAQRLVYGTLSEEIADRTGEILDYESAKPAFREWSDQFRQATNGKSLGNVRAMHGAVAAGKFTDIQFNDADKRIEGVAKIIDEDEWQKVLEGVYTGFSIGGGYARRWPDPENPALMRYTPCLSEVSLVDNPALPSATFEIIKQDGSTELRKFSKAGPLPDEDESGDAQAALLLDQLDWLEDELEGDPEHDDILEHIHALQDFLSGDVEEEPAGASDYVSELARGGAAARPVVSTDDDVEKRFQDMKQTIEKLQKRLAAVEAQPVPAKGRLRQDEAFRNAGDEPVPEERRVHELMKKALARPVQF